MLRHNAALGDNRADASATPSESNTTALPGSQDARIEGNPDPSLRLLPMGGADLTSSNKMNDDADSKRPKLSYQRTIIACGHCRRRKIRCMPSEIDGQPCSMCLKLKKDCVYVPVTSPTKTTPAKGARPPVKKKKADTAANATSVPSVSSTASSQASSSPQATSSYGQEQSLGHVVAAHERMITDPSILSPADPHYMSHVAMHPAIAAWNPQVETMQRSLPYAHDSVYSGTTYDQYEFVTGGATGYGTQSGPLQTLYSPDPNYTPPFWQTAAHSVPHLRSPEQETYVADSATAATPQFNNYAQTGYEHNLHHPNEGASYSVAPPDPGTFDPALYSHASAYGPQTWMYAPDVTSEALAERPPNSPHGQSTEPG